MGFFDFLFNTPNDFKSDNNTEPAQSKTKKYQPLNEEFSLDMTTEPYGNNMYEANNSYANNGVEIQDARNVFRLVYSGILAKNNTDKLYAVIGYGNNLAWEDTESYSMQKIGHQKFELLFPVKRAGNINIAFKDDSDNWDNNSGMNYCFKNYVYEGSH
ncbi:carbohydrate-binding protein [Acetivibrio straminisolvens]|uniref:Carbohydrate binding family 25 n=1 Tax=Acetivibrio straminisolvens JCM 21531 TaxID=1294263 RepID=W4V8N1_9FIRM|nr:carbohydrate-binding protein [Acetivibrio straminisolvens]GAE89188.1 carbohydrate binding family 25 [Acetivibrio straminisolvens JCM 21531]